jgi:hypothetical protein
LFAIRKVECVFNNGQCPVEILEKLNRHIGSNVLLINQKELIASIKNAFPVEKISVGFKIFNILRVRIDGRLSAVNVQVSLTQILPQLSMDILSGSTESAAFTKPSDEIGLFNQSQAFVNFELWDNGLMIPIASSEAKIKYLFTEKPDKENIKSVYRLVKVVEKYLDVSEILILNQRVFLRQEGQPDIIVNVPFDEDNLVQALQTFAYLSTIKKDAKVIDLRFKNPILR